MTTNEVRQEAAKILEELCVEMLSRHSMNDGKAAELVPAIFEATAPTHIRRGKLANESDALGQRGRIALRLLMRIEEIQERTKKKVQTEMGQIETIDSFEKIKIPLWETLFTGLLATNDGNLEQELSVGLLSALSEGHGEADALDNVTLAVLKNRYVEKSFLRRILSRANKRSNRTVVSRIAHALVNRLDPEELAVSFR